jgi:type II secretory ATPase GspE/PulE/Tfp pilus assembly ATPase PilB-like protein
MIRERHFEDWPHLSDSWVAEGEVPFLDPYEASSLQNPTARVEALVLQILQSAVQKRASDIHIEPTPHEIQLRFRIDGRLETQDPLPLQWKPFFGQRLKMLADQDINQTQLPQEGQFKLPLKGEAFNIRLTTVPCLYGEAIALRLLPKNQTTPDLARLGFLPNMEAQCRKWLSQTYGWVLAVGPTGAGKSTTLYTFIELLRQEERKIITVEDPVEMVIPGISQVSIHPSMGLDFPQVLRAVVRQAPNVILIGEIRDALTAEIALNAALTGHLVLSSIHADGAWQAVGRLVHFGLNRSFLMQTLTGIIAQRLAPKRCTAPHPHTADCLCEGRGFLGRMGVFEALSFEAHGIPIMDKTPFFEALPAQALNGSFIPFEKDFEAKVQKGWLDPLMRTDYF